MNKGIISRDLLLLAFVGTANAWEDEKNSGVFASERALTVWNAQCLLSSEKEGGSFWKKAIFAVVTSESLEVPPHNIYVLCLLTTNTSTVPKPHY